MLCFEGRYRSIYGDISMSIADNHIHLIEVDGPVWQGVHTPSFLPVGCNGTRLCGAVVYWSDMPDGMRLCFTQWLQNKLLSISMPPVSLPRAGRKYFLEDVLAALEYQWSLPHGNA